MALNVIQVAVSGLDDNFSYVIYDEASKNAAVVDPSGDLEKTLAVVEDNDLGIVGVLVTHTHHDHIDKLGELLRNYMIPTHVHEAGVEAIISPGPILTIRDGETISLGASELTVLYTPGHINDAVCFYVDREHAADGVPKLITGDTLFVEGCGRTTEAHVRELYDSLQKLKSYPDKTEVYPGHDYGTKPSSTIGYEKKHNKYFLAKDFGEFRKICLG